MIPNRANRLWLQANEPGYYYGQCAEYCGESHAIMRFRVIALAPADFDQWLAKQKQPARAIAGATATPAAPASPVVSPASVVLAKLDLAGRTKGEALSGSEKFNADPFAAWQARQSLPAQEDAALIAQGSRLFKEKNCIVCHTIRGFPNAAGINAPDLTHVGSRSTIAAGVLENTPQRMGDWLTDPDHWKPGNKMFHGITSGEKVTMPGYLKPNADGFVIPAANGEVPRNIALSAADITALTAYLQSLK